MKLFYLLLLSFAFSATALAQSKSKDTVYQAVDSMATFSGGESGWVHYMVHNLKYPPEAMNNRDTGRIIVQFIVDQKGKVSHVKALNGPLLLQQEAIRLIKESPRWIPAVKDGVKIACYQQQSISFRLE